MINSRQKIVSVVILSGIFLFNGVTLSYAASQNRARALRYGFKKYTGVDWDEATLHEQKKFIKFYDDIQAKKKKARETKLKNTQRDERSRKRLERARERKKRNEIVAAKRKEMAELRRIKAEKKAKLQKRRALKRQLSEAKKRARLQRGGD